MVARERQLRVLALSRGVSGALSGDPQALTLPDRLPTLPATPAAPQDAEQTAMDKCLDVPMAGQATEATEATQATAKAVGLTHATRFINVLHAGDQNKSSTGETPRNGYAIELQRPLFDVGSARTARAEALYLKAVHRTAQAARNARSGVRGSYSAYRTA